MIQTLPSPFNQLPKNAARTLELRDGDHVFRQGDPTIGMFYLLRGQIRLERTTEHGDRLSIHLARPDETFAEASLFSERYHCDAVCVGKSTAIRLDKRSVLNCFTTMPDFALALASSFAQQVQSNRHRLELLAVRSAQDRVLHAVRDGLLVADIKSFAAAIGLTHEATYRALAALVDAGKLVKPARGTYRQPV